jgi:glycosyltransferase involved in cell wall biosynthesis
MVLTRDEEQNLPSTLESLQPLSAGVFIVDSGGTDQTVEIARAAGFHVVDTLRFLDAKAGLVFHLLQGFWYRFLVDAMVEETERPRQTYEGRARPSA